VVRGRTRKFLTVRLDLREEESMRRATQGFEYQMVAGPGHVEVRLLRERYGYKPEATGEAGRSRLEWKPMCTLSESAS
jgi:hypothetical protein